jgi:SagB-type dehydrogenase family enzyme
VTVPARGGRVALRYHDRTKHSYESVRAAARALDWANYPYPFKEYLGIEAEPLPEDSDVAWLLRVGAGVVRKRRLGPDEFYFRAYSSAGGLYPIEVYVADERGLFHFHPLEPSLRRLRDEDVRGALVPAKTILVLTGILWRSAWKYQARAYRHLFWDAGTMLANLLALAAAADLEARVLTAFVDDDVNRIVGADGEREAALALVSLGHVPGSDPGTRPLRPLELATRPLSASEREYPEARELHRASRLQGSEEVERYRAADGRSENQDLGLGRDELERTIRRRGSIRDFALEPIALSDLASILTDASGPIPADFPELTETRLIVNAVDGLEPGAYRFEPPDRFELVRAGSFRRQAGYLVLEQPLGARAAAVAFFLADLHRVLELLGNRGYRAAQLEAGIRTGRAYISAFARGLASTASTFYDDDVTSFLAPGTALSPMLCAAVGAR